MARGGEPFPAGCARDFVRVQFVDPAPEVARAGGHEPGKKRHCAANGRIGWGIIGAASEIRHFQSVRVDRHVPVFRERQCRAGMVEVSVRQDDGFWRHARAETRFGRFHDLVGSPGKPGID